MSAAVAHGREAGLRLIEAKSLVPSKGWLAWLKSVGIAPRTARKYIQIARLPDAKLAALADFGLEEALKAIAVPPPRSLPGDSDSDSRVIADLHAAVAAGQRWSTFYADPPWAYDNQATRAATHRIGDYGR